jgi:mercuric ion transport protein
MPTITDRVRPLPSGLTGLAGLACAACCAIPLLLAAGVLSGVGWAAAGSWLLGVAVVLAALAGGAWWLTRRRHRGTCGGGTSCGCSTGPTA